jgi:hypothetical protein
MELKERLQFLVEDNLIVHMCTNLYVPLYFGACALPP